MRRHILHPSYNENPNLLLDMYDWWKAEADKFALLKFLN